MKNCTFASSKGGVGKSTLTGHLAAEAERHGAGPVAIVDCDPQGSLAEWWNSREAETPLFARATCAGSGRTWTRSPAKGSPWCSSIPRRRSLG